MAANPTYIFDTHGVGCRIAGPEGRDAAAHPLTSAKRNAVSDPDNLSGTGGMTDGTAAATWTMVSSAERGGRSVPPGRVTGLRSESRPIARVRAVRGRR